MLRVVNRQLGDYCRGKVPPSASDRLRISFSVDRMGVTLLEERPRVDRPREWFAVPVARFRYSQVEDTWTLYWCDRNLRWHRYAQANPARTLKPLLREVDRDPTGIFWG